MVFEEYTSITQKEAPDYCKGSENQKVRDYIKSLVGNKKVLEVGCGNGIDASRYTPEQYTGIDISKALIMDAQIKFPNHQFFECNIIGDTSMLESEYDVVYTKSVLEHTPSEEILKKMVEEMTLMGNKVIIAWHTPPIYDKTEIIKCQGHFGKTIFQNHYRKDILDYLQLPIKKIQVENFQLWIIDC